MTSVTSAAAAQRPQPDNTSPSPSLLKHWEAAGYRYIQSLRSKLNQLHLLEKASDPTKRYIAKVSILASRWKALSLPNRGEALILSIPPHSKIKTVAERYFFGNHIRSPEKTDESEFAVFISEYSPGIDLLDYLMMDENLLPPDQSLQYAIEIGEAVSYLHEQGIVYRDLKPQNVLLLGETKKLCLIDFEYAKQRSSNEPLTPVGSAHYAPPELHDPAFRDKSVREEYELGDRSDSFAFGMMVYMLYTKTYPFATNNLGKEIGDYGRGTPLIDLSKRLKDPLVLDVVLKLLARNPKDRITVTQATEKLKALRVPSDCCVERRSNSKTVC